MAALREEVEESTSRLMSGNLPAGLRRPSELPEWKQSCVFLEVIEELKTLGVILPTTDSHMDAEMLSPFTESTKYNLEEFRDRVKRTPTRPQIQRL